MYCIHCGKEIADGSQFCGFCGKSQSANAQINSTAVGPSIPPAAKQQGNKSRLPLIFGVIAIVAVVAIGIVAVAGGQVGPENSYVLSVKNGTPIAYPDKTYGEAFDNFFGSPKWRYFKGEKEGPDEDGDGEPDYTEDNVDVVEFTGRCTYQDVDVNALIQFTLSQDDDTFEATYLSFNDVPQSMLMLYGLLDKAFGGTPAPEATHDATEQSDTAQNDVKQETSVDISSEYDYTDNIASGGPLDDFVIKGYTYSEAVAQGWGDEFEAIANSMGSDGESPVARFYWFIDDCDKTYFSRSDLEGFDKDMAMLARNAIYAHEGRNFTNATVKEFFESCAWYFGYIEPDSFQDSMLNDFEKSNKELIVAYEKEMGYK